MCYDLGYFVEPDEQNLVPDDDISDDAEENHQDELKTKKPS